ncbi:MAG TPA: hypothetical protein VKA26_15535 [Ignavibacteriaceae bacterium]|nr:hypothetical protein [Ignavibacteriaceae bacterium]
MKKTTWTIIRTALFLLIGLMNTVFIRPEDIGSWKNYAGYFFMILAILDTFFLVKRFLNKKEA